MKIFKLYLSFLKSFLKVGIKINILILLISITAVLSFVTVFGVIKSNFYEYAVANLSLYNFTVDNFEDETLYLFRNDLPKIISKHMAECMLGYYSKDKSVICEGKYYPVFPESITDTNVYINMPYSIYSGRNFENTELTENKNVIIASKNSMLNIGDIVTIQLADVCRELTVIGVSEYFMIPLSFIKENKEGLKSDIYNPSPSHLPYIRVVFERDLSDDETEMLRHAFPTLYCELPIDKIKDSDAKSANMFSYVIAAIGIVLVGVFAAIQVYTLFLYLTSKMTYKIAVIEICGCSQNLATAIILLAIFTYIVAAFIGTVAFLPAVINTLKICQLNYIPTVFDFIMSFIIYVIIVTLAVLPGIMRVTKAPLARGLNT